MYINVLNSILSSTPTENNYHCAKNEHPPIKSEEWGPKGFWGFGKTGFLFSGWGAIVIIFRDFGSKLIVWGIYGALQKSNKFKFENLTLKEKPSFRLIF